MTIKGLWKFINDKHRSCLKQVPQSSFKGLRVAIDAMGIFFRLRMRVRSTLASKVDVVRESLSEDVLDNMWLSEMLTFVISLMGHGITPVLVFETGTNKLKEGKKNERDSERRTTQTKISELRSTLRSQGSSQDFKLLSELRKLEGSLKELTSSSRMKAYEFFRGIGIPTLIGKSGIEAEKLCSILTQAGVAAATYSPDGDCLCHGCPITIRGEGPPIQVENFNVKSFEIVYMTDVLQSTGLSQEQFTDVCIMSGCDYNDNIPNVGIVKSFNFIKLYGRIERVPSDALMKASSGKFVSLDCLIFQDCREEFAIPSNGYEEYLGCSYDTPCVKVFDEEFANVLVAHNQGRYIDSFKHSLEQYVTPRDFAHKKLTKIGFIVATTGDSLQGVRALPAKETKGK